MGPICTVDPALALSEVEVRAHEGIRVDEPGVDVVNRVVHIDFGTVDNPGKSVV